MKIINSSTILDIEYNPTKKQLIVTFISGDKYSYQPVNPTTYTQLSNAESKGKFFSANIKNAKKIRSEKIGRAEGLPRVNNQASEKVEKQVRSSNIVQMSKNFHQLKKTGSSDTFTS